MLPGEVRTWEEMKIARIKALRGKYKTVLTPSEEFAKNRALETILEG